LRKCARAPHAVPGNGSQRFDPPPPGHPPRKINAGKIGEQDAPGVTFESNSLQERCSAPNAGARVPLNSLNREKYSKVRGPKKNLCVRPAVRGSIATDFCLPPPRLRRDEGDAD
jgi:hypothetical protein